MAPTQSPRYTPTTSDDPSPARPDPNQLALPLETPEEGTFAGPPPEPEPSPEGYVKREFGNILKSPIAIGLAIVFVALSVYLSIGTNRADVRAYINDDLTPGVTQVTPWAVLDTYGDKVKCAANACSNPSCSKVLRELVPEGQRASDWECFVNSVSGVLRFPVAVFDTVVYMFGRGLAGILVFGVPFVAGVGLLTYASIESKQPLIVHPMGWLIIFVVIGVLGLAMRLVVLGALAVVDYTLAAMLVAETVYTLYEKFEVGARAARNFNDLLGRLPFASLRGPAAG